MTATIELKGGNIDLKWLHFENSAIKQTKGLRLCFENWIFQTMLSGIYPTYGFWIVSLNTLLV